MTTLPAVVDVPASLLKRALVQLDRDEGMRLTAAVAGHRQCDDEGDVYSACAYTLNASTSRANQANNRWANIYAFDHSLLPGDYLNASVIPPFPTSGHADRRSYIASQAPLPHTLPIFYANLIARKVSLVVNLTAFTEHGRVKSDEYWPMKKGQVWESGPYRLQQRRDPQLISDATLTTSSTLYSLRLENKEKDKEQQHDFALLHVTSWPDFGAFSSSVFAALLDLIDKTANKGQDIWVHCSAGIGRSGTVIAALLARDLGPQLASALQLGRLTTPSMVVEGALQAAQKLVDHERRYRPKMVQTADQLGMVANAVGVLLQQREE